MLYGGFATIFTAIMQYIIMILQANGQFKYILIITLLGGFLRAGLSFFLALVPSINIYAILVGNIVMTAFVSLLGLTKLKNISAFSVKAKDIFLLLFGTFLMFMAVHTFIRSAYFSPYVNILLAVLIGVVVYGIITIPFLITIVYVKKKKKMV